MDDEKENLCIISEDNLAEPVSIKLMPSEWKKSRESGKCNLRKSLAWNNAFFTEEGVLDPLELSRLSGSIMNTGGKSLCELNVGGLSPLTELNHSSSHLKHFISKSSTTQQARSERKLLDATQLPLKTILEEEKTHSVPSKMTLRTGSSKKPPQAPTAYSQKRAAHVAPTNPTTKIPKVMSKPKLAVTAGNFQQKATSSGGVSSNPIEFCRSLSDKTSTSIRGVSSNLKEFGRSLSARYLRQDSVKRKFQNDDKVLRHLKNPSSTSAAKLLEPNVGRGSCDMSSAVTQDRNHTGSSAPVLTKPTALRMPSPPLGFFSQGKAPPSYNDPSPPNMKPTISTFPSKKGARVGVPKLLSTSDGKKPVVGPIITTAGSEGVTSKSMPQSSVASRSKLSVHGAEIAAISKMEMEMSEGVISRTVPQSSVACRSKLSVDGAEIAAKSKTEMKEISEGVIFESIPGPSVTCRSNLSVHGVEIAAKSNIETKDTNGTDGLISASYSSHRGLGRESSFLAMSDADTNKKVGGLSQGSSSEDRRLTKQIPAKIAPHNSCHTRPTRGNDVPSGHFFLQTDISKTAEGNCIPKSCSKQQEVCSLVESLGNARGAEVANVIGSSTTLPTPRARQENSFMQVSHIKPDHVHKIASGTCYGTREDIAMEVQPTASDGNEHQDCRVINMKPAEAIEEKEEGSHTINKAMSLENVKAKPDALALKCPINAAPFSNEWLAALEAFGEDILQLKTGPVQNSPTDKAPPAPGPWSPVKRKAQDIGPFDCTKYSKNNSSTDEQ